jgi:hypothetical protein
MMQVAVQTQAMRAALVICRVALGHLCSARHVCCLLVEAMVGLLGTLLAAMVIMLSELLLLS